MPPASRNHRVPTAGDTPALTAASSLECPVAIATQNRRCSSRRRTEGRPGERSFARPARSERLLRVVIATPFGAVLRRLVESTLPALIRVMNHRGRSALRDGHVERGQDELGAEMGFHRPADDAATPRVEHDGEIQEAGPRRDVRDVRDPQPIGAGRRELAVDEIRGRPRRLVSHRRVERFPAAHALDAGVPHEPGDTLAADLDAARREFSVDAWRAVRAARHPVNRIDVRRQLHIGPRPRRQRSLPPRVVPAGGDTQHAAHGGDWMDGLVCGHELESLDGIVLVSRANQAAAFERIARSSRSWRTSRRSRRSSSRSSVMRPSARSPAPRAASFIQFRIDWADGSNWRANSSGVRPLRTSSMSRCRNSGGYGRWLLGIVDAPFRPNHGVSTKPGQLQPSAQTALQAQQSEQARILEMIKTGSPDKAAENLRFLLEAGLIADPTVREKLSKFLDNRNPGSGP